MGDKNDKNKHSKKKMTKKELKALNHQKLMENKKSGTANSNVIQVDFNRDKKAA